MIINIFWDARDNVVIYFNGLLEYYAQIIGDLIKSNIVYYKMYVIM